MTDDVDQQEVRAEFARRLAKALADRGMKPADLARKAGVGRDSISLYLHEKSLPTTANLRKIAVALDLSEDDLMPGAVSGGIVGPEWEITPSTPPLCRLRVNKEVPLALAMEIVGLLTKAAE